MSSAKFNNDFYNNYNNHNYHDKYNYATRIMPRLSRTRIRLYRKGYEICDEEGILEVFKQQ